jgi:glycosyltransferase involved in cell wall biosynthesis
MNNDVLYIVMPAYNEESNIEETVTSWYPVIQRHNADGQSRLLVFNDGSKDSTSRIGKTLMQKYPLFQMIDKSNSGHGNPAPTIFSRLIPMVRLPLTSLKLFGK